MVISTLLYRALLVSAGTACLTFGFSEVVRAAAISFAEPIIDYTNFDSTGINWTLGFQFRTNREIKVNRLGFYDAGQTGLNAPRTVQILDKDGKELVKGIVGVTDPLYGWFRYTEVPSTTLAAGGLFTILAVETGTDPYTWNPKGFWVDPAIQFLGDIYLSKDDQSNTLIPSRGGVNGWFGPNFDFESAIVVPPPLPVPGPAPTAIPTPILLPGLLGMGWAVFRRQRETR